MINSDDQVVISNHLKNTPSCCCCIPAHKDMQ